MITAELAEDANSYTAQANKAKAVGKLTEALSYYNKALEIYAAQSIEENKLKIARTYFLMGNILQQQDEIATAQEFYTQAATIFSEKLGIDHPETSACMQRLEQDFTLSSLAANISINRSVALQMINAVIYVKINELEIKRVANNRDRKVIETKHWNLPIRSPNLIKRSNLLSQIGNKLNQPNASLLVCYGLPGTGKTQLLVDFVYENLTSYDHIFWFSAASSKELAESYLQLAKSLGLGDVNETKQIEMLKGWMENNEKCLLVFSKAPSYEVIEKYLPRKNAHILVSSRYSEWPVEGVKVGMFTIEQAKQIFHGYQQQEEVEQLINYFGLLPFGLFQAHAYMSKNKTVNIRRYLELLANNPIHILSSMSLPVQYQGRSVFHLWDEMIEMIKIESLLAFNIIHHCCKLATTTFTKQILCQLAKNPQLNPRDEIFYEAMGLLYRYSIFEKVGEETSTIHPLLQKIFRLKEQRKCDFFQAITIEDTSNSTEISKNVELKLI